MYKYISYHIVIMYFQNNGTQTLLYNIHHFGVHLIRPVELIYGFYKNDMV